MGIGRALLRHAVAAAGPRVEVTVLDGNLAAEALYASEGFTVTQTRTGPLVGNEAFTATGHIMHRDTTASTSRLSTVTDDQLDVARPQARGEPVTAAASPVTDRRRLPGFAVRSESRRCG